MKDLVEKCRNEKWYQTIKFYYHRLASDQKQSFIMQVADVNILLASQCLMSDTRNDEVERVVMSLAYEAAQSFSDAAKSSAGLLALAEFQQNDIILDIFNSLYKPKRIHLLVLNQVFREADPDVYLKFLATFTDYDQIGILLSTFTTYKGPVPVTPESIPVLKKIFVSLIDKGYSGFVRAYLKTYHLSESALVIFAAQLNDFISRLLTGNDKDILLAEHLVESVKWLPTYPPSIFITALVNCKGKKSIILSLQLALKYGVFDNKDLNSSLLMLLPNPPISSKKAKVVRQLLNRGLRNYSSKNPKLTQQIAVLTASLPQKIMVKKLLRQETEPALLRSEDVSDESLSALRSIFGEFPWETFQFNLNIEDFWRIVFDYLLATKKAIMLEDLLQACSEIYKVDFKTICPLLNGYIHSGIVERVETHGYYIQPSTFASRSLCYLHPSYVISTAERTGRSLLNEGEQLTFCIVGFKAETRRINIRFVG